MGICRGGNRELALQRSPHDVVGQTRAQAVFMQEGGVPGQSDILVAWPAEHVLCSAPLMHAPLEPSLASHSIREVRFCKREVPG